MVRLRPTIHVFILILSVFISAAVHGDSDFFVVGKLDAYIYNDGFWYSTTDGGNEFDTEALTGVWGNSGDDIFSVGTNGTIIHFDGAGWSLMPSGTTVLLRDIWGTSSSDIFAVGQNGVILHYDGSGWSEMPSPTTNALMDVFGFASDDVWAVGDNVVLYYDGVSWIVKNIGYSDFFEGIWGTSSGDLYIGSQESGGNYYLLHFPGDYWRYLSAPSLTAVNDICGAPGGGLFGVADDGEIHHYNGGCTVTDFYGGDIHSLTETPGGTAYAAGWDGRIFKYNGSSWIQDASLPGVHELWAIHAISDTCIIAVGENTVSYSRYPLVYKGNGTQWTLMYDGYDDTDMTHVWGAERDDVFVGLRSTSDIMHWNGANWTSMNTGTDQINEGIWGTSNDNVFAVTRSTEWEGGKILHYDGILWSDMLSDPDVYFRDIHGNSPINVWAVGTNGEVYRYFLGDHWTTGRTEPECDMQDGTCESQNTIWVSPGNDVFIGGALVYYADGWFCYERPLVCRRHNGIWSSTELGYDGSVGAIWGFANDDVYAGWGTEVWHFDGLDWTLFASIDHSCADIWGSAPDDLYFAGGDGVTHFNGSTWTLLDSESGTSFKGIWGWVDDGYPHEDHAIHGTAGGDIFCAVWTEVGYPVPEDIETGVDLNEGECWFPMQFEPDHKLNDLWCFSDTSAWFVGDSGLVLRYDGIDWTENSPATGENLGAAWGDASGALYVAGQNSYVAVLSGSTWTPMTVGGAGSEADLHALWGLSPTDIFAAGAHGSILHYTGGTWDPMTSATDQQLYSLWGASSTSVYAVGHEGVIVHFNGSDWSEMTSGVDVTLRGVWGVSDTDVVAVGDDGTILHYNGAGWAAMTSNTTRDLFSVWGTSMSDIHVAASDCRKIYYDGVNWQEHSCVTGEETPGAGIVLEQNYPNPFNPSTTIVFSTSRASRVRLAIYDVSGKLVRVVLDEDRSAGRHEARWDGQNSRGLPAASGVFFYTLSAGDVEVSRKMILLR